MALYNAVNDSIINDIATNQDKYKSTTNKWNLNLIQYPENLGSSDAKQFVLFNINVRGKSQYNKENRIAEVRREDSAQLSEEELARASKVSSVASGALAGAAIPSLVANFSSSAVSRTLTTGASGKIAKGVGIVGGGIAGGVVSSMGLLKPDTSYRISDAIALYISEPPSVKYNAQYSNKDLGTLAGLVGGISGVNSVMSGEGEGAQALLMQFAKVPSMLGVNAQDIIGASAKVALNPFKEVLFESIDFRSFAFKYRFMPKSETESKAVFDIIQQFKFHMHPELSENKLFFIYPSEFEISYFYEQTENKYFHKFKPCVLESLDVNYGGEQYSSFKGGNPTEINLSLVFRETEILTKQQIKNGY